MGPLFSKPIMYYGYIIQLIAITTNIGSVFGYVLNPLATSPTASIRSDVVELKTPGFPATYTAMPHAMVCCIQLREDHHTEVVIHHLSTETSSGQFCLNLNGHFICTDNPPEENYTVSVYPENGEDVYLSFFKRGGSQSMAAIWLTLAVLPNNGYNGPAYSVGMQVTCGLSAIEGSYTPPPLPADSILFSQASPTEIKHTTVNPITTDIQLPTSIHGIQQTGTQSPLPERTTDHEHQNTQTSREFTAHPTNPAPDPVAPDPVAPDPVAPDPVAPDPVAATGPEGPGQTGNTGQNKDLKIILPLLAVFIILMIASAVIFKLWRKRQKQDESIYEEIDDTRESGALATGVNILSTTGNDNDSQGSPRRMIELDTPGASTGETADAAGLISLDDAAACVQGAASTCANGTAATFNSQDGAAGWCSVDGASGVKHKGTKSTPQRRENIYVISPELANKLPGSNKNPSIQKEDRDNEINVELSDIRSVQPKNDRGVCKRKTCDLATTDVDTASNSNSKTTREESCILASEVKIDDELSNKRTETKQNGFMDDDKSMNDNIAYGIPNATHMNGVMMDEKRVCPTMEDNVSYRIEN